MCLKINRSVKRRDTGLVNWELLAPGYGLLVADVPSRKTSPEARSEEKQMLSQARKNSAWAKKKNSGSEASCDSLGREKGGGAWRHAFDAAIRPSAINLSLKR